MLSAEDDLKIKAGRPVSSSTPLLAVMSSTACNIDVNSTEQPEQKDIPELFCPENYRRKY